MRYLLRTLLGVCLLAGVSFSAPHSASGPIYQRVICVVPMVGAGTLSDPKRPMFAPVAGEQPSVVLKKSKGFADAPVIVGYHSVLSDDGNNAIVEFVARDRAAFKPLLEKTGASVQVFQAGQLSPNDLVNALQKVKKNFDLTSFLAGAHEADCNFSLAGGRVNLNLLAGAIQLLH